MGNSKLHQIIIVGAGISGLSLAHFLQKKGIDALLIEGGQQVGGKLHTVLKDGYTLDFGANSAVMNQPALATLISDLDLLDKLSKPAAVASKRYLVRNGKLNGIKPSPFSFLATPQIGWKSKWSVMTEYFRRMEAGPENESLHDFIARRFTTEVADYLLNPVVRGIYAGDPKELGAAAVFPQLVEAEREHGSILRGMMRRKKDAEMPKREIFNFKGGFATLYEKLAAGLNVETDCMLRSVGRCGEDFQLITEKGEFRCKQLVFASPAPVTAALLRDLEPAIGDCISDIAYSPVSVLQLGYDSAALSQPADGFGFLVPSAEQLPLMGAIWTSAIFPDKAPAGKSLFTLFIGGGVSTNTDQLEDAVKAFESIMGVSRPAELMADMLWAKAIPQYDLAHVERMKQLDELEKEAPGISLLGNYRGGVSVGDCVQNASLLAERIAPIFYNNS